MAEAAVATAPCLPKYYCHQCTMEINPNLPDLTCPKCDSGFIEEVTQDLNTSRNASDETQTLFPAFMSSLLSNMLMSAGTSPYEDVDGLRDIDDDEEDDDDDDDSDYEDEGDPFGLQLSRRRTAPRRRLQRYRLPRRAADSHASLNSRFLERLLGGLGGSTSGSRGARSSSFLPFHTLFHGDPGDYAWGADGLDNVISQLLNQLEGSGPVPMSKESIEALPLLPVTQQEIDAGLQCSVCMEDYSLSEIVRSLPCHHVYHPECIAQWLKLHGTCPICRQSLVPEEAQVESGPGAATAGPRPEDQPLPTSVDDDDDDCYLPNLRNMPDLEEISESDDDEYVDMMPRFWRSSDEMASSGVEHINDTNLPEHRRPRRLAPLYSSSAGNVRQRYGDGLEHSDDAPSGMTMAPDYVDMPMSVMEVDEGPIMTDVDMQVEDLDDIGDHGRVETDFDIDP